MQQQQQGVFLAQYEESEEYDGAEYEEAEQHTVEEESEYEPFFSSEVSDIIDCNEVLYTGKSLIEMSRLVIETINKLLVDTGCNQLVVGDFWFRCLLDFLPENVRQRIERVESDRVFQF